MPYDNQQTIPVTAEAVSRESLDKDIIRNSKGIVELHLNNPDKVKLGVPLITTEITPSSFNDVIDNAFTYFIPPLSADPSIVIEQIDDVPIIPSDGTFIRQPAGRIDMINWKIWLMINGRKRQLTGKGQSGQGMSDEQKTIQVMLRERDLTYKSIQIISNPKDWENIPVDPTPPQNRKPEWTEFHPSETAYEALPPNDPIKQTYWDQMRVKYEGKMIWIKNQWSLGPPYGLQVMINGRWRSIVQGRALWAQSSSPDENTQAGQIFNPNDKPGTWANARVEYGINYGFKTWPELLGSKPSTSDYWYYGKQYYEGGGHWVQSTTNNEWMSDANNKRRHSLEHAPVSHPTNKSFIERKKAIVLFDMIARTNNLPTFTDNSDPWVPNRYARPDNGSLWFHPRSFTPWVRVQEYVWNSTTDTNWIPAKDKAGKDILRAYYNIDNDDFRRIYTWKLLGQWFPMPWKIPKMEADAKAAGLALDHSTSPFRGGDKVYQKIHGISYEIISGQEPFYGGNSPFSYGTQHAALTVDEYKEYLDKGPDKWDKDWLKDYYPEGDQTYYGDDFPSGYAKVHAAPFAQNHYRLGAGLYDLEAHGTKTKKWSALLWYAKGTPVNGVAAGSGWNISDVDARRVIAYAQEQIFSKPDSDWYKNVQETAKQNNRLFEYEALHEVHSILFGPTAQGA